CCFFFQAEDGIRDFHVTGVQTCALPIFHILDIARSFGVDSARMLNFFLQSACISVLATIAAGWATDRIRLRWIVVTMGIGGALRSEEHTSELQSRENLVCRLLHEKKKKI